MDDPKADHVRWRSSSAISILSMLVAITALHLLASPESVISHNVFRRLYYLPIVWAAYHGGLRWSLAVAFVATAGYLPHAFFMEPQRDPAPTVDKLLEVILFFGVGGLAGILVDRERRTRARQEKDAVARASAEARVERLASLVHFSRGLAHEIRNPLGGIQGAIEILADEVPLSSPRREMIDVGLRETERLNAVLSNFLEFARPSEPQMGAFRVEDVIRDVVELQEALARRAGVNLQAKVQGSAMAFGDRKQITQVLLNLVRNAMEATPPGGVIRVVCAPSANGRLCIQVFDSGRGIPNEIDGILYDPYVSGRENGTGLGLSISAMLVKQHGGSLSHAAREGGGTVFQFDIPTAAEVRRDGP